MSSKTKHVTTTEVEASEEQVESRQLYLRDGRTLTVSEQGQEELVEVRASSGQLELRIRLTEQGPVLQMESVRLELRASESVEVETRQFKVRAEEQVSLQSHGDVEIASDADLRADAKGEVRINGTMIYLN